MAGPYRAHKSNDRRQMLPGLIILIVVTVFFWVVFIFIYSNGSTVPPYPPIIMTGLLVYGSIRYKRARKQ